MAFVHRRALLAAAVLLSTLTVVPVVATVAPSTARVPAPCTNTPTGGSTELRSPYAPQPLEDALAAQWASGREVGDQPRSYLVYVPQSVSPGPVPLVMTIHGLLGNARQHFAQTQWAAVADRHGFVVIAPNGRRNWDNSQGGIDDDFLRDVVADMRARNCIDARRIYVTGHSNGGFMTHRMACEHADLFAAGASYAAGDVENKPQGGPCSAERTDLEGWEPMPLGLWHGTDDTIVDYAVGRRGLAAWIERYDCDTPPMSTSADAYGSTEVFGSCARPDVVERAAATGRPFTVLFRTLDQHGHAWPDGCGGHNAGTGGTVECDPSANTRPHPQATELAEEIWSFLSQQVRAEDAPVQPLPSPDPPAGPDPGDALGWIGDGVVSGMDSSGTLTRIDSTGNDITGQRVAQDPTGIPVRLRLDVATGGDGAGVGPSHPLCPTASPGPSTQTMPGRPVTISLTDSRTGATSTSTVATRLDDGAEIAEATFAALSRSPSATMTVRARVEATALKWWWVCGTPPVFYKETVPVCVLAVAGPRRCLGAP
jgi:polyhydroxybutyrate depolymerase